jgi:hypothetical protein
VIVVRDVVDSVVNALFEETVPLVLLENASHLTVPLKLPASASTVNGPPDSTVSGQIHSMLDGHEPVAL